MKTNEIVRPNMHISRVRRFSFLTLTSLLCLGALFILGAGSLQAQSTPKGMGFTTADEAVEALVSAAEKFDENQMMQILGPDSYDIIHTGEIVVDRENATKFATLAREKKAIKNDPRIRTRAYLNVGDDEWPFPIPLVKQGSKWFFDTSAGRQEILYRRIGANELDAIQICRGYVEAQHAYALEKHDGALVNQYAQKIISTPGKHDGLAWQNPDGTWAGTVGENAAKAIEKSYAGKAGAFHGYYFKILRGQGPAAPLGKMDFMVKDAMIGGFALLAYPAVYQGSGVKTFMVSHDGVVWEKDLGSDTLKISGDIDVFNPDKTWKPVLVDQ